MTDDLQSKLGLNLLLTGGSKHQESRKPNSSGKMIKGLLASLLAPIETKLLVSLDYSRNDKTILV
jgi:hypothetical protein